LLPGHKTAHLVYIDHDHFLNAFMTQHFSRCGALTACSTRHLGNVIQQFASSRSTAPTWCGSHGRPLQNSTVVPVLVQSNLWHAGMSFP
jgi:hypothetical protein